MRTIDSHSKLHVEVFDEPGNGGACHVYRISGYDIDTNAMNPEVRMGVQESEQLIETYITFQNGPISAYGVNGITHEALLAILADRLNAFQTGPYACDENAQALRHINDAQAALMSRTLKRMDRGVEGTGEV